VNPIPAYKVTLEPEDTDDRVVYFIDRTGEPPITDENAGNALDTVMSANDGYRLKSVEPIDEADIPADERPYEVG